MLKSAEPKEIHQGLTIRTTMLPAIPALRLANRLGRLVAPAVAEAGGFNAATSLAALGPVFSRFFSNLRDEEVEPLVLAIFAASQAQISRDDGSGGAIDKLLPLNTSGNVNQVFEGDLEGLISSLWHVLTVNFSGFISAATAKFAGRAALAPPPEAPAPK